jgi:hypothetical protein
LFHVPSPREVLALQALGRRCVSLLAPGVDPSPHVDSLAFATHDLCHLEKLMAPEHHQAQVGFFALLDQAMADPRWQALEQPFDSAWMADRDHVMADMNGSAAFLFVPPKNKLKLAVRRRIARDRALDAQPAALDRRSEGMSTLGALFDLLGLEGRSTARAHRQASRRARQNLLERFAAVRRRRAAAPACAWMPFRARRPMQEASRRPSWFHFKLPVVPQQTPHGRFQRASVVLPSAMRVYR